MAYSAFLAIAVLLYFVGWFRFGTRELRKAAKRIGDIVTVPQELIVEWIMYNKQIMDINEFQRFIIHLNKASIDDLKTELDRFSHYLEIHAPEHVSSISYT
ncbi:MULTISPECIES: hypothetical protein [Aliivibrio]|jgi:hypothetical protein|uniref:Uncharacterized protein n=3 Tax=Aliivibrio TaxID=511678 RepID=A0A1B9NZK1_ALILO|nr:MULTISPECIES: hypothetical protein [Aliivibrio]AZL85036.1 hypothetical protein EIJ81_10845 [Aliivibrio salmonicida]MBB1314136.1 hypothetical protein [Aliivibrio sp. SR45-2]OCH21527.1 hypothetical protein A6E04_06565 [Aliivibrio logei]OEF11605.1 hypothetical protein A1Q5_10500 [Aliivibrio logei 5S-186]CAQ79513.1 putative membrane protein [Aliivibrio salmonicida LFI1238]